MAYVWCTARLRGVGGGPGEEYTRCRRIVALFSGICGAALILSFRYDGADAAPGARIVPEWEMFLVVFS